MGNLHIGMSFSGGGYRAATFDLGGLSLLNALKIDENKTLLDCVTALTSVSGGTITALKYMLARARGQDVNAMVAELFSFLCDEDLVVRAMKGLSQERANRNASAIKIMAGIYDEVLYKGAVMQDIIDSRIQRSCELLTSTDSRIEDIAEACGYGSVSHFVKLFREKTGITPAVFRKNKTEHNQT